MGLREEAAKSLYDYWYKHPQAYLQFRKEQIAQCKDANGKVLKRHRKAHDYYVAQIKIFEDLDTFFKMVKGE